MDVGTGFRIGHGWDRHRLAPPPEGRELVIGGVQFEHDRGPVGHSDGDVLLHAVTDALLGALALPDIGTLFPDDAAENEGRDSRDFVRVAMERVRERGYRVVNLDATVVLERPKLKGRKDEIRGVLAELVGVGIDAVNVKGKTGEGVDAVGEGRAVEAQAVVLLVGG